jgi:hypothetical protein
MQSVCLNKRVRSLVCGIHALANCLSALALIWCGWQCVTMSEDRFLDLTSQLHGSGVAIAYFDGAVMLAAVLLLLRDLSKGCRTSAIKGGALFFIPALAANMLDFFTTIIQSPDLALETNAVWNAMKQVYGLQVALLFGFWGKIYLSVFAAICFTFYLNNVHILFPRVNSGPFSFVLKLGERCIEVRHRLRALAVVFAFYFAAINLFCFYIAYTNYLVTDLPTLSTLPALPAAIAVSLLAISISFIIVTMCLRRRSERADTVQCKMAA